jgi:hypothetical protein
MAICNRADLLSSDYGISVASLDSMERDTNPTGETKMKTYIIQTAATHMPNSCWGVYRRVAVLEVEPGIERVAMISDRARGVRSVVQTWEALNVGSTARCAYARALADARALVSRMTTAARTVALGYDLHGD